MKYVKLFEAFVNEAKNPDPVMFSDMFAETMANLEASGQELSTENLLYILQRAWKVVAEENSLRNRVNALEFAFIREKIKTDRNFMGETLIEDAEAFGNAVSQPEYYYDDMIECFGYVITELGLLKPAQWKKVKKRLEA